MKIPEDPKDAEKRAKGQLAGSRGKGFVEITEVVSKPQHVDLFKKMFGGKIPIQSLPEPEPEAKKKKGGKKKK